MNKLDEKNVRIGLESRNGFQGIRYITGIITIASGSKSLNKHLVAHKI